MKLLDSLTFETAFNRPFLPMQTRNVAIFVSNSTRMVAHFATLQFENWGIGKKSVRISGCKILTSKKNVRSQDFKILTSKKMFVRKTILTLFLTLYALKKKGKELGFQNPNIEKKCKDFRIQNPYIEKNVRSQDFKMLGHHCLLVISNQQWQIQRVFA